MPELSYSKVNCTSRSQGLGGGDSREPFPQGLIFHHGKLTDEDLSKRWVCHVMVRFHRGGERFHGHHGARRLRGRAAGRQVAGRLCDVVHESAVLLLRQPLSDSVHLGFKDLKDCLLAKLFMRRLP